MTPPPVSVAHVTTIVDSLDALLLNQLRAIRAAGYSVTGISRAGEASTKLEAAGIRHLPAPFVRSSGLTPGSDLRLVAALVQMFRREKFTIVHTHTAKADLYASVAARIAGVPIVVTTLHGFYFHDLMPPMTRRFYAALARVGMTAADRVLSQNPEDIETAIRERICPASKIEYLGNGIDIVRFDRARVTAETRAAYRESLGIPATSLVIGVVARMVAEKGILELLEAAARLRARFPGLRVLLVGPFDLAKADAITRDTADRYGVGDLCVFTGHRTDLPELYAVMDVFALPSHREGFPRTPMEASAMSVPVVATNIRGCRSAVVDGSTGLLVRLGDAGELAEALARLLADENLRREMGQAGRRVAVEQFDERRVFAKVLSAYDDLRARRVE